MRRFLWRKIKQEMWLFRFAAGAALVGMGLGALSNHYPARDWYEPHALRIGDGPVFNSIPLTLDRTIRRRFPGEYAVAIWTEGGAGVVCTGGGSAPYSPASGAIDRDLGWLSGDQQPDCDSQTKPGQGYYAILCHTIHPEEWWLFWMPPPRACIKSNVFRKTEQPE